MSLRCAESASPAFVPVPPPRLLAVTAERVAEAGYRGLMRGQRVVVPGFFNRLLATLTPRFVPRSVLLAQLDARQLKRANLP